MNVMYDMDLLDNTETVNRLLARYGVKFGIYKNNTFKEQLFPFDAIPRVIQKKEFDYLERGFVRLRTVRCFSSIRRRSYMRTRRR